MKNICISFFVIMLSMTACTPAPSPSPAPAPGVPPVTPANPYYFNFSMNGTSYNYHLDFPQYMPFEVNEAGGYQSASAALWPSVGLRLTWPPDDTVKESDLLGLAGK